jgi:hypothetical protein
MLKLITFISRGLFIFFLFLMFFFSFMVQYDQPRTLATVTATPLPSDIERISFVQLADTISPSPANSGTPPSRALIGQLPRPTARPTLIPLSTPTLEESTSPFADDPYYYETDATPEPTSTPVSPLSIAASHNSPSDCWVVRDDTVYNVTEAFGVYPEGDRVLQNYCGKNITNANDLAPVHPLFEDNEEARFILEQLRVAY